MKNIILLAVALLLVVSNQAKAQAPANDNFANAATLVTNVTSSISNTNATVEATDQPNTGFRTLWYRYTAPQRGIVTINTPRGPALGFRHQIIVYRGGSPSALNYVTGATATSNSGSLALSFLAEAGMEFRIIFGSFNSSSSNSGNVRITVTQSAWPYGAGTVLAPRFPNSDFVPNDNFLDADTIPNNTPAVTVFGYNGDAGLEPGEPSGFRSLWYKYTAQRLGIVRISTPAQNRIGFGHIIRAYQATSLGERLYVAGQQTSSDSGTLDFSFPAQAGTEYKIVISSFSSGESGEVIFNIQESAWPYGANFVLAPRLPIGGLPANDNYANADVIPNNVGAVNVFGYNASANLEVGETGGFNTLWYEYTVPTDGYLELKKVAANFPTAIGVINANTNENLGGASNRFGITTYTRYLNAGTRLRIIFGSSDSGSGDSGPFVFSLGHTPFVNQAPITRILFPRNNSTISKRGVTLRAVVNDDQGIPLRVELRVNGKSKGVFDLGSRLFTGRLKGKTATIEIRCQDSLGLWGPYSRVKVKVR